MYKVYFTDNSVFEGGTLNNSKWNDMPNKSIIKIEYRLGKAGIMLSGYESYNHLVERSRFMTGNYERITKVILLGKKMSQVDVIIYDLIKKTVVKKQLEYGKEYNNRPTTGWKKGHLSSPYFKLI